MLIFLLMVLFAIGSVVFLCAFPFLRRVGTTFNRFGASRPVATPVQAVTQEIARSFDFQGRSGRKEFWSTQAFLIAVWMSVVFAVGWVSVVSNSEWVLYAVPVVWVAVSIPALSLCVRRLHDLNMSGFWLLIGLVFGYVILLYWFCQPTQDDDLAVGVF